MEPSLEVVDFNLNIREDGTFHIHDSSCFVMWRENAAGLGLINRALRPYMKTDEPGIGEGCAAVGNRHELCIIREKLQDLRFELL